MPPDGAAAKAVPVRFMPELADEPLRQCGRMRVHPWTGGIAATARAYASERPDLLVAEDDSVAMDSDALCMRASGIRVG